MLLEETPELARWTTRVAAFSALLIAVAVGAHRFGPMPTLTAFNLVVLAFASAAVALLIGLAAAVLIWRQGYRGGMRVGLGILLALAILGSPLTVLSDYRELPALTDISTDPVSPPKFVELAKLRDAGSNPLAYPRNVARTQAEAYPDLKPLVIQRPVEEAFEIVREAVFRQKMQIVNEHAPDATSRSGLVEAVDRTLILGLYDDVAVRVEGEGQQSKIDLRSASRFGSHDLGRNAARMRRLMREIVARLEATIPSATGESYVKWRKRPKAVIKRALDNVQAKGKAPAEERSRKERRSRSQD